MSVAFGLLVGAAIGVHFAHVDTFPAYLVFAVCAVPLAVTDLATFMIPNRLLGPAAAASLLGLIYVLPGGGAAPLERGLLAAAVVGVAFLALAIVAGGGFGLGDVKLLSYLALLTGYQSWNLVLVSLLAGFVIAALAAATMRQVRHGSQIALAPWLIGGAVVALVL
ncbi:prepilin peptidase [Actinospica robiniae]|uniref:prepilin peptidase n=1 Tax=Actinospica robiniae TaxID=304901 RepID=UPI000686BE25|nr:prepilin peptidase [Actinospica robiniae]